MEVNPDNVAAAVGGGGLAWLIWSKLKRALTHDQSDIAAFNAMKETIQELRTENARLHESVSCLQDEVSKLNNIIYELNRKIANLMTIQENQETLNRLAREGLLERRNYEQS